MDSKLESFFDKIYLELDKELLRDILIDQMEKIEEEFLIRTVKKFCTESNKLFKREFPKCQVNMFNTSGFYLLYRLDNEVSKILENFNNDSYVKYLKEFKENEAIILEMARDDLHKINELHDQFSNYFVNCVVPTIQEKYGKIKSEPVDWYIPGDRVHHYFSIDKILVFDTNNLLETLSMSTQDIISIVDNNLCNLIKYKSI